MTLDDAPELPELAIEPLDEHVDHVRGPSAGHLIVEYGDYECPYSRRAFREIEQVEQSVSGGIRFAFRHFPLTELHPHALAAAAAAEAAALQDKFWPMHGLLFHHQKALEDDDLRRYAGGLGLDLARFDQDRAGSDVMERIRRDVASGESESGSEPGGVKLAELPELHLADWRTTKDTLHLYCQIVGKIRLATTAPRNHWWNAPLYVDVRGLTTRRLHHGRTTFEITLDFVDHAVVVRTADGRTRSFELDGGLPVADFDARLHATLRELGIDVAIKEEPFGLPMKTPFTQDSAHASWDRDAVERFGRVLDWSDSVFEEFSGWFNGKISPVHLFWHSLDLAVTRFSGRPAPPLDADQVTREAYTHEVISFGFWAGDDTIGDSRPGARCSRSARAHTKLAHVSRTGIRPASPQTGARPRISSGNCGPAQPLTSAGPVPRPELSSFRADRCRSCRSCRSLANHRLTAARSRSSARPHTVPIPTAAPATMSVK